MIRHGIGRDEIDLLAQDMARALERLTQGVPSDAERSGFHH